jgi:hypothetical protein
MGKLLNLVEVCLLLWCCFGIPAATPDFRLPTHIQLLSLHALQITLSSSHTDFSIRAFCNYLVLFIDTSAIIFQLGCYLDYVPYLQLDVRSDTPWRELFKLSFLLLAVLCSICRNCERIKEEDDKEEARIEMEQMQRVHQYYPPPMDYYYHSPPPPPPPVAPPPPPRKPVYRYSAPPVYHRVFRSK